MVKNFKRYIFISILAFSLFGCTAHLAEIFDSIEEVKLESNQAILPGLTILPSIPSTSSSTRSSIPLQHCPTECQDQTSRFKKSIHFYDWNNTIQLMIKEMSRSHEVVNDSVLLVDSINNRTNTSLNVKKVTEILRNALITNKKFKLVSEQQLSVAKQKLGLSSEDSLSSCSKTIGIARKIGAQYVLCANATKDMCLTSLQIQLIFVPTGEIIWSGKNNVRQLFSTSLLPGNESPFLSSININSNINSKFNVSYSS